MQVNDLQAQLNSLKNEIHDIERKIHQLTREEGEKMLDCINEKLSSLIIEAHAEDATIDMDELINLEEKFIGAQVKFHEVRHLSKK